jgi:cell division protein FtsW
MMHQRGYYDRLLLFAVLMLLVVGVVMVYSSSSVVALTTYDDPTFFMKRQLVWALFGLVLMAIRRAFIVHLLISGW